MPILCVVYRLSFT